MFSFNHKYAGPIVNNKYLFAHYLRGLAALSVMLTHYGSAYFNANPYLSSISNTPQILNTSYPWIVQQFPTDFPGFLAVFGVSIFFLISGFVIPMSIEKHDFCNFLNRRFFRLVPTYLFVFTLNLAIAALGYCIYKTSGITYPFTFKDVTSSYSVGLNNLFAGIANLDPVSWTLAIEIVFYFISAIFFNILFSFAKRRMITQKSVITLSIILSMLVIKASKYHSLLFSSFSIINSAFLLKALYLVSFMLIGTSFYLHAKGRTNFTTLLLSVITQFSGFVYVSMHILPEASYIDPSRTFSWFGLTILSFSLCYALNNKIKVHKIPSFFADISYPLYLCHSYIGYFLIGSLISINFLPRSLVIFTPFPLAIFVAWLIHKYIETPSNAMSAILYKKHTSTSEEC